MTFRFLVTCAFLCSAGVLLNSGCQAQSATANKSDVKLDLGNATDILFIGDPASERAHQLSMDHAEAFSGALGTTAIHLLPLEPPSFDGGSVSFVLRVDPVKQNYISVRLWGSDKGEESGRLVLYVDGKQVGYRNQGDYDLLNQTDEDAEAPGRFFYETRPLPLSMTAGKTSVSIKVAGLGRMWPYGDTFERYQKVLQQPTRGMYAFYSHTNPRIEPPKSQKQGQFPERKLRTTAGPEVIAQSKQIVIDRLSQALNSAPSGKSDDLDLLPEAYNIEWTPAYHNPAAIERVLRAGDTMADEFLANTEFGNWAGAGSLGEAIMRLWPAINEHLDEPFAGKATGLTRRQAWSKALRKSIDFWRTHRRYYTNQSMIVDLGIYRANRGLLLIDPAQALPEAKALHYLYEAIGLEPWRDSDVITGNGDKPLDTFNSSYYLVSRKGLSRELGWVGTYGETILQFTRDMADLTSDAKIRQQLAKIQDARLFFRYPGFDADGYNCLKISSEVDNRTAHYPVAGAAYSSAGVRESWWMAVASMVPDDAKAVGAAQRSISDGQYFAYIQGRLKDRDTRGMMRNIAEYEKVKALPPVNYKFPMEDGQPDFVFSDDEDAMVALKHGDTRLFVNLYFRAESAVNNVAKILEITPTATRIVTAKTQTQVQTAGTFTRPDYIDSIRGDRLKPAGQDLHQAWAGETLPISVLPGAMRRPTYGKEYAPLVGRAAFYWVTYGDYLIGLNTTEDKTYDLPVPDAGRTYTDLVSKKLVKSTGGVIKVQPLSTVVLYLGE